MDQNKRFLLSRVAVKQKGFLRQHGQQQLKSNVLKVTERGKVAIIVIWLTTQRRDMLCYYTLPWHFLHSNIAFGQNLVATPIKFYSLWYHIVAGVHKNIALFLLCCILNQHICPHTKTQPDLLQGQDST